MSDQPAEGKAAHVLAQPYYYVAAVTGVGLLLGGAIGALFGLRYVIFGDGFDGQGLSGVLHGLAFAVPGFALMWWHLREARRRERMPMPGVFWGRSLYLHLVALISLVFVLIGTIGALNEIVDALVLRCDEDFQVAPFTSCWRLIGRRIFDFAIFGFVGGPVFVWHLRQGRRLRQDTQDRPTAA